MLCIIKMLKMQEVGQAFDYKQDFPNPPMTWHFDPEIYQQEKAMISFFWTEMENKLLCREINLVHKLYLLITKAFSI